MTVVGIPVEKKKLPKQHYEKMSTFGVYYLFLYFVITQNLVGCNKWVDDLTEYVAESLKFKPVMFITGRSEKKKQWKSISRRVTHQIDVYGQGAYGQNEFRPRFQTSGDLGIQ